MSIWTEIKHALNGTLGTDKFKPLDVILRDEIKSHKGLVASDNLYKVVVQLASGTYIDSYSKPELFRANWDGSIKLSFRTYVRGGGSQRHYRYKVYKNGEIYRDITSWSSDANVEQNVIVETSAGDVIGLELLSADSSQVTALWEYIHILANEVDLTAIDVLEV